jgi:hypothetical protein
MTNPTPPKVSTARLREIAAEQFQTSAAEGQAMARELLAAREAPAAPVSDAEVLQAAKHVVAASTWIGKGHTAIKEWPAVVGGLWAAACELRDAMRRARPAPAARREEVEAAIDDVSDAMEEYGYERGRCAGDGDFQREAKRAATARAALLALLAPPASDAADRRGGDGG